MSKSTPAKKTAAAPPAKGPEPMDPTFREVKNPEVSRNQPRDCYALQTLRSEVEALFPGVPSTTSNANAYNTALSISFDLTTLDDTDASLLLSILDLMVPSARVESVMVEDKQVIVTFRDSLRTQDSRETFALDAAYAVLIEGSL